VTCKKMSD